MYYLRTNAAADAIKFTLDKSALQQSAAAEATANAEQHAAVVEPVAVVAGQTSDAQQTTLQYEQKMSDMMCSLDNPDACEACGS
jgi:ribonucleoside-diphosphate reductase alpha chain